MSEWCLWWSQAAAEWFHSTKPTNQWVVSISGLNTCRWKCKTSGTTACLGLSLHRPRLGCISRLYSSGNHVYLWNNPNHKVRNILNMVHGVAERQCMTLRWWHWMIEQLWLKSIMFPLQTETPHPPIIRVRWMHPSNKLTEIKCYQ